MGKRKTKIVNGKKYFVLKDGSLGAETGTRGKKKKNSKDVGVQGTTRSQVECLDMDRERKPRIHRGAGQALHLADDIERDIESKGCVYRWVTDENSRVQMFIDDWWDIYLDARGESIRVLAGTGKSGQGVDFVLMIQKKEHADETNALKRKKAAATLESQQALKGGNVPEYVVDGQDQVIERVAGD